jgi:hypothetical protein
MLHICLSGGPAGGKSTSISKICTELQEKLGIHCIVNEECATQLITGGIYPGNNISMDDFQEFVLDLQLAKEELSRAVYLEDCGSNAGIRKMNANKAEWLKCVVYLAELGLETEKYLSEPTTMTAEEPPKTDFEKAMAFFKMVNSN